MSIGTKYHKSRIAPVLVFISLGSFLFSSCLKWHDPKPYTDPKLSNPYCNDPNAVNYNWGFPGRADDSICFYPADLFKGRFLFTDSIYSEVGLTDGNFLYALTDTLYFTALSQTKLAVTGFCGSKEDSFHLTALSFNATIDTLAGDSLTTFQGQVPFCRILDTVNGTLFYSRIDSQIHISFQIKSDTGLSSHVGKARAI